MSNQNRKYYIIFRQRCIHLNFVLKLFKKFEYQLKFGLVNWWSGKLWVTPSSEIIENQS